LARLERLPDLNQAPVGAVLIALEAKAAMTEHQKAEPRLYDELNSSHLTVHGDSNQALATGLVMVNASPTFLSPSGTGRRNVHKQPDAASGIVRKVKQIPRRANPAQEGFDGLGIVLLCAANDGTPVTLVSDPPAPPPGDIFNYETMIRRVASLYSTRFASI
jgi:hypothetical protein